jgi:hypothetical protein
MFENMKKPTKITCKTDENLAPLSQEDNSRSCKMNDNLEKWTLLPWIMDEHVGTDIGKWMKN